MNKIDLYKLPKDILVELIFKTQENILNNKKLLIETLNNKYNTKITYTECEFDNCNTREYSIDKENYLSMLECYYYCDKHYEIKLEEFRRKERENSNGEISVIPTNTPNFYREINYGFIIERLESGNLLVHSIVKNGKERGLTIEEGETALDLGLCYK